MAITNKERVGRALDTLKEGLYPFIEREMRSVYRDKWVLAATSSIPDNYSTKKGRRNSSRRYLGSLHSHV